MMNSMLDLTTSITLHPHPFPLRSISPSSRPVSSAARRAASTSFELNPTEPGDHVPIAKRTNLSSQSGGDLEGQSPLRVDLENDPYQLAARLKTDTEVDQISRLSSARKRDHLKRSIVTKHGRQARRVQDFYRAQNENIERLLTPVDEHRNQARQEQSEHHLKYRIAIHGSFWANVMLAGLQLFAAISSKSLSLITTMADAIFDPLSNLTLIMSHRAIQRVDARRFPSGKARIETAGNIVFCFIMCSLSSILIVLSIQELASGASLHKAGQQQTKSFHLPSVIAVAIAFCTKVTLFLYCWTLRNTYSQIRIIWQDHRNDIIINGFGLMTSIGGSKLRWWIDPSGAIILSVMVIILWLRTAYSEFMLLIGVTANVQLQQLITYVCMSFL